MDKNEILELFVQIWPIILIIVVLGVAIIVTADKKKK